MTIVTWNVNGIRARYEQVQALVAEVNPDVVCLQEIKASPDQVPELVATPPGYWAYWHGSGGYSGVALLVRQDLAPSRPVFDHPAFDMEHRVAVANLGTMRVASVYVPNGGKDYEAKLRFLEGFVAWVEAPDPAGRPLVVCGDLNVALETRDVHVKERKPNQIGTRDDERAWISRLIGAGLRDLGRALDPGNEELFTWWPPWRNLRQRNIGWRIDYVLASAPLADRARTSESRRTFGTSDHAPVVVTFAD